MEDREENQESDDRITLVLSVTTTQGHVKVCACTSQRIPSTIPSTNHKEGTHLPDHYKLSAVEFLDNSQLSILDSYLTQLGEVDVYCSEDLITSLQRKLGKRFSSLLETHGIQIRTERKALFAKASDTISFLHSIAKKSSHIIHKIDCELVDSHALLEFLLLRLGARSSSHFEREYTIELGSLETFMRLDSAAAEAINLMPSNVLTCHLDSQQPGLSSFSSASHPSSSLYGLLNQCRTKLGSRLLQRWLRQPLVDVSVSETFANN